LGVGAEPAAGSGCRAMCRRPQELPRSSPALLVSVVMRGFRRLPALVDSWFDLLPANQRETAHRLHGAILAAEPQAETLVRSGNLFYGLGHDFGLALAPHRTHVHLQVLTGGEPSPAFPDLVRSGKGLLWRFKLGDAVDAAAVGRLAVVVFSQLRAGVRSPIERH
jgi:hypothetical protein